MPAAFRARAPPSRSSCPSEPLSYSFKFRRFSAPHDSAHLLDTRPPMANSSFLCSKCSRDERFFSSTTVDAPPTAKPQPADTEPHHRGDHGGPN